MTTAAGIGDIALAIDDAGDLCRRCFAVGEVKPKPPMSLQIDGRLVSRCVGRRGVAVEHGVIRRSFPGLGEGHIIQQVVAAGALDGSTGC